VTAAKANRANANPEIPRRFDFIMLSFLRNRGASIDPADAESKHLNVGPFALQGNNCYPVTLAAMIVPINSALATQSAPCVTLCFSVLLSRATGH
jgi:hypothetical protein